MKDLGISNVCSERLFARHDSVISHTFISAITTRARPGQTRKKKKDQTRKKKKKKLSVGRGGIAEVLAPALSLLRVNSPYVRESIFSQAWDL